MYSDNEKSTYLASKIKNLAGDSSDINGTTHYSSLLATDYPDGKSINSNFRFGAV